jgi:hypothetical protein
MKKRPERKPQPTKTLGPVSPTVYTKPVKERLDEGADAAKQKQSANKKHPQVIRKE